MSSLSAGDAQALFLRHADRRHVEMVPPERPLGRVLAQDIRANRDLPPCDVSAMDGYAVRSADPAQPLASLEVSDEIRAGNRAAPCRRAYQRMA